jgi:hypothetical protein
MGKGRHLRHRRRHHHAAPSLAHSTHGGTGQAHRAPRGVRGAAFTTLRYITFLIKSELIAGLALQFHSFAASLFVFRFTDPQFRTRE